MNSLRRHLQTVAIVAALATLPGCDRPGTVQAENATSVPVEKEVAPARTGFADSKGARIAYHVYGDLNASKAPLVILHGSLMSGASMAPMIAPFAASRPVIAIDARGHGRTGDVPGPITYELMADDAAAVLRALNIKRADVLGDSMGGTTAIVMAVRHPDLVDKQVIVSGVSKRAGWVPEAQASFEKWNAKMFAGTPIERSYKRESATPEAFASVVDKLRGTESANYDVSTASLRAIPGKTMIVVGDADGVQLTHALELFEARGGANKEVALKGFMTTAPRARLAVLPATSHIGMFNEGSLLARLVVPFLDDRPPARPAGFFEGIDAPAPAPG